MQRPNILFFTCHDLGRHLNSYGHRTVQSPNLDALADSGIKLDNMFCTAPQCSPSRASLHTGRYPHTAGMLGLAHSPFDWRMHPGERHLAQVLHEHGYATALVGIQHLVARGEAERLGYERVLPVGPAKEVAEGAVALLHDLAATDRPFYLEVGFEEPHRPYDFGGAQPDDSLGVEIPAYLPDTPEAWSDLAAFQGAIRAMDAGVGRVLAALRALGLEEDTWVVFATDHGAAMPRAKCTLYDPGIEVAFLTRWSGGGVRGGRSYSELLSNVDVVPTVLEGLGLPLPENLQGQSFWALLQGTDYVPRTEVFVEKTFHTYYEPMRGLRTTTHKYIVNFEISTAVDLPADIRRSPVYPLVIGDFARSRAHVELYDLTSDPWERTNVAGRSDLAETEADLGQRLRQWMQETQDPLLQGPIASPYYYESMRRLGASSPA
jgi:N-sulfoglucosamine sulfohydrolase